jgi:gluconolactonase
MHTSQYNHRRHFLKAASAAGLLAAGAPALAQSFAFAPNQRHPDPAV